MRLLHFLEYDISEGLIRFWRRYLWLIVLVFITCLLLDRASGDYLGMYGESWSPLGYIVNAFWGQRPFHFNQNTPDQFRLPLAWILQYILLAYCIGNYVEEDMHGFGMQLMLKSRSRVLWWSSKCICCVCINLFYFLLLYGMTYGYAWISTGNMSMSGQQIALSLYYGEEVANTSMPELIRMTVLLPVLAGIVQSMMQLLLSLYMNSAAVMSVITFILVLASYYGNRFLVHGYAMACRYYSDRLYPQDEVLTTAFGIPYLICLIVGLVGCGYGIIRKRNIIW